jgi:tyrosine-protein kinase Etk/Wzc
MGALLAMLIVLIRKSFQPNYVDDPHKLERMTGIPVHTPIPFTKAVRETIGFGKSSKRQKALHVLRNKPDPAIEGLRSLRSSISFALKSSKNNIVMITGVTASEGTSFISSNLAAITAAGEKKVLLIDADLRKGHLHHLLKTNNSPGFAELLAGTAKVDDVVHTLQVGYGTMDVITRGETPLHPSELLMHSNLSVILNMFSKKYDLVVIDTPPIDELSDQTVLGRKAGIVFIVVRSGLQTINTVTESIKSLSVAGVNVRGFILNGYKSK